MYFLFRIAFLILLGFIAWRLWQVWKLSNTGTRPPPAGFTPDNDPLVRCDRCGIRAPSSQVAAIRANCKLCLDTPP